MYVCGITPYDVTRLGHATIFLWVDALGRVLRLLGVDPEVCRNVTDMDDVLDAAAFRARAPYDAFTADLDGSMVPSAAPTSGTSSTIGTERRVNLALRSGEAAFVAELIAGLSAYPRYYVHIGPANRRSPRAPDLARPARADPAELRRRIDTREWVVDLRERRAFARAHVTGTISVEFGDSFSTYLGWAISWGTPLTLVGESPDQVAEAQLHLARIGIDHIAGAAAGPVAALATDGNISSYRVTDFGGLAATWDRPGLLVLDIRRPDEWQARHLDQAVHGPFWEIGSRAAEVPVGEVWLYCASGLRASIGASILDRAGRQVVHVDDDWETAPQFGLPLGP
jgi:rhodanese-related sulfurtransferase